MKGIHVERRFSFGRVSLIIQNSSDIKIIRQIHYLQMEKVFREKIFDGKTIKFSEWDKYRHDVSLLNKNPFYKRMVEETNRELLSAEASFHDIQTEARRLSKLANASRKKTLGEKISKAIIPQEELIINYLEAEEADKKTWLDQMTKEEIGYAHFIKEYFADALNYLVETQSLKQWLQNYFVHIRQGF